MCFVKIKIVIDCKKFEETYYISQNLVCPKLGRDKIIASQYRFYSIADMSKKVLLLTIFSVFFFYKSNLLAQDSPLFTLPDTVCAGHELVPGNVFPDAQNYSWTFCPAQLQYTPQGVSYPAPLALNAANAISVVQSSVGVFTGFTANDNGTISRLDFPQGIENAPVGGTLGDMDGNMMPNPKGLQAVYDGAMWHVFVIGGDGLSNSSLLRIDFANGLQSAATNIVNLGNVDGMFDRPQQLYITKDDSNWYGFTFNRNGDMIRLNFGNDLNVSPTATMLGDFSLFHNASGMTAVEEYGMWYVFATDKDSSTLIKMEFGADLSNDTPNVTNMGNFSHALIAPNGIAITKGCNEYYAYVLNAGGSLAQIHWESSIDSIPNYSILFGNIGNMVQPTSLTQFVTNDGSLYLFTPNNDNSLTKVYYDPCDNSNIASSNEQIPPVFKYDTSGYFTVYLTVNEGLSNVSTYCKTIYIEPAPPLTSKNDTLICQGDTVTLYALSFGTDSFKWSPVYNIDTPIGRVVRVWPQFTTEYVVEVYYKPNCIVKEPVNVTVSQIAADAGPDRIIGDGAETMIGGANTSVGSQYSYNWFPDSFMLNPRDRQFTSVRPMYDITYYLEVRNQDGCYKIDSTIVSVPCDDIHLPNAFTPQSPNQMVATFGLNNLQIVKISYFNIYDRWGKKVFETTDPNQRWDGKFEGKDVPMGVYVWEIDAFCNLTGQRYHRSGSVTLLR